MYCRTLPLVVANPGGQVFVSCLSASGRCRVAREESSWLQDNWGSKDSSDLVLSNVTEAILAVVTVELSIPREGHTFIGSRTCQSTD